MAAVHGRAASRVALTRSTSAAVVSSPGCGCLRSSPSRSASSRRSTRSTSSSPSQTRRRSSTTPLEHGGDLVRVDRRAEADAGPGSLAVEVGGDEERHRRQRIVVGDPRAGSGAQLELAGPTAGGEPIGEAGEQRRAGIVGVDAAEVEGDAGAPGDVGRAVAHAGVLPVVAARRTSSIRIARSAGRRAVADDVALVDERGDHARQRVRPAGDHPGQAGMDGQPEHAPPERGDRAVGVERAELRRAGRSPLARPCAVAGRGTGDRRPACPTRPARARARRGRPG